MLNCRPAVLIVDDESAICDLLSEVLGEQGYICKTALNANEAITKLEEQDFDVALLDIMLPGMSGLDLLMRIGERHPTTSTIIITALNDGNAAFEAKKRGAADFIVKPFAIEEIRAKVEAVMKNRKSHGHR